jgi:hypothetical protein
MQHRSNTGDQENPFWVMALRQARAVDWDLISRIALGPAATTTVPHQQAGHMTAPDQFAETSNKPLPNGSRPHMTQSGHLDISN